MLGLLKRLPILRTPAKRRFVKQLPGVRHARRAIRRARRAYHRTFGRYHLQRLLARCAEKKIVIGAWSRFDPGWIPTQRDFLDLTKAEDWERFFQPNSVDAMLAEHVWEHLSEEDGLAAAQTCFKYLKPGGYLRVAVPDGLLPDPNYIESVKAGASGDAKNLESVIPGVLAIPDGNSANHKALYTYKTLKSLFERAGFRVVLYEYLDEAAVFHYQEWNRNGGTIWRSLRFDPRNIAGKVTSVYPGSLDDYLAYSSIVLDAFKEQRVGSVLNQAAEGDEAA